MHMIFHTIYDNGFTIWFIDQITNDTQKFWPPFFNDNSIPVFYCEHSLQVDLVVGVGHDDYFYIYRAYGSLYIVLLHCYGLKSMVTKLNRGYASGVFKVYIVSSGAEP